jgi:hypothetical protein
VQIKNNSSVFSDVHIDSGKIGKRRIAHYLLGKFITILGSFLESTGPALAWPLISKNE